ncbi:MAG: GAF domain-containing protein [Bryobacterales bacterium]|nr:GAF domain-containing protein [Bryobacteraceae bacterium]MDW8131343.1 GAF domain-containing protein [Bryobacterales bacterium]
MAAVSCGWLIGALVAAGFRPPESSAAAGHGALLAPMAGGAQVGLGVFLGVVAALALTLAMARARGRRLEAQRQVIRKLFVLGEEVLAAGSQEQLVRQMRAVLPALLGATGLRVYVYNRNTHALEEIEADAGSRPTSIPVDRAQGLVAGAVSACFRNQTLLAVPDARRSPFLEHPAEADRVRALLLAPMMAQTEVRGVLEIHDARRKREFGLDEQMMIQHVANQAAIALRLMEEQRVREQLSRTERMAAAGQLLSGVAAELRGPVGAIVRLTEAFLYSKRGPLTDEEMRTIAVEAERAKNILERLVSFIQPDRTEARPVDLRSLLAQMLEFRRPHCALRGIEVHEQLGAEPVWVLGSRGQLERVFLNLLMHAEQALADSFEKRMSVSLSVLARRALVEIAYTASSPHAGSTPGRADTSVLIEGVIRGIVQSHGGETRLVRVGDVGSRMEVELPLAPERAGVRAGLLGERFVPRLSTVLLVEPDPSARGRLMGLLSSRGYRVVPAASAEQGAELAQRVRFDLVFCASQLPGLSWLDFFHTVRRRIQAFVLVSPAYDPDLARELPEGQVYWLAKPTVEIELERLLLALESAAQTPAAGPAAG